MATTFYKTKAYLISKGKTEAQADAYVDNRTIEIQDHVIKKWDVSGITKPTDSELSALDSEGDKLYTSNRARKARKRAYDEIGEQLDQLYWDKKNGTNKWVEAIDKVKSDNPKP
tara:strand:+ start:584 stop:925 length:342 start_codon:yes stop_codon:yes gene_type:complete